MTSKFDKLINSIIEETYGKELSPNAKKAIAYMDKKLSEITDETVLTPYIVNRLRDSLNYLWRDDQSKLYYQYKELMPPEVLDSMDRESRRERNRRMKGRYPSGGRSESIMARRVARRASFSGTPRSHQDNTY